MPYRREIRGVILSEVRSTKSKDLGLNNEECGEIEKLSL